MASTRIRTRSDGSSYTAILWREDGKQTSLSFDDHQAALNFKKLLEQVGPAKAREINGIEEAAPRRADSLTVEAWCMDYIDHLTGIENATRDRYRSYVKRDYEDFSAIPLNAMDEKIIAAWVNEMDDDGVAGKTIANKHGFLSAAFKVAVRKKQMPYNPCEFTKLPNRTRPEMCFLTGTEFTTLRAAMTDRWKPLATFLVTSGARFSEATALQRGDIDADAGTVRIARAWKYTGKTLRKLGGPKTKRGLRTINVPPQAIEALGDLSKLKRDDLIFTTVLGTPVSSQLFRNKAWLPALAKIDLDGKSPRPHDLRHTCASWMIADGVPLPVIQGHLGHESITTTIDLYGHLDRRSYEQASDAVGRTLGR